MKAQDFLKSGSDGDAIRFLDEAIDALTLETVRVDLATGDEARVSPLESCISEEMGRMDRALRATPDSRTMLARWRTTTSTSSAAANAHVNHWPQCAAHISTV